MAAILGCKVLGTGDRKVIVLADWSAATDDNYHYALPFFDLTQLTLAFVDVRG